MKMRMLFLLFSISLPAVAQSADTYYQQACGPKDSMFTVEQVQGQANNVPQPGKALVFFIQKDVGMSFTTRLGVDGNWMGVLKNNSYAPVSVMPGERHLCAATQFREDPEVELLHFKAEAGKVYYFLVRGVSAYTSSGGTFAMLFDAVDRDEALYLIASDPQSVAKPRKIKVPPGRF